MSTTMPNASSNKDSGLTKEEPDRKPYWACWNPNLPWMDLALSWLVSFLLPFNKVTKYEATSKEACAANDGLQAKYCKTMKSPFQKGCQQWSEALACGGNGAADAGLVQCTWRVPRRSSILHEWGLIDEQDPLLKQVMRASAASSGEDDFVTVHVTCPASIVTTTDRDERTTNECGCAELHDLHLKDLPRHVPILVWFHGGGLTLGTCDDASALQKIQKVLLEQKTMEQGETLPPLVLVSVDYRLAPNHPLPAASIDALCAIEYCLKSDLERRIHVSGESAGGYLSLVSAFACHQHYPGRIQSALVMIPFLSPAADSISYYMNGPSSKLVPVSWLRWCWRASLEMNDDVIVDTDDNGDVLAIGSNRTAWNNSKWKQNEAWHKFLEPMAGIPAGLDDKEKGIKYIVAVSKADPLYDEGKELANKLKEHGADVDYLESRGSHATGFEVDRKGNAKLMALWRAAIFDSRNAGSNVA